MNTKGNPGNGFRPEAGTVCLVSGPNCDDADGYTWLQMTILWRNDIFVLYGKDGFWPVLQKWDLILAKPLPVAPKEMWLTINSDGKVFATSDHLPTWEKSGVKHVRYVPAEYDVEVSNGN